MSIGVDHVSHRDCGLSVDQCARMFGSLVIQLDEFGRCVDVSQNAADILDCSSEDLQGQLLGSLLSGDDQTVARVQAWLVGTVPHTETLDETCRLIPKPGGATYQCHLRGLVDETGVSTGPSRWLAIAPCDTSNSTEPVLVGELDSADVNELYRVVRKTSHDLNNALTAYHCFWSVMFGDDPDAYSHSTSQLARVILLISDQARVLTEVCNRLAQSVIPE